MTVPTGGQWTITSLGYERDGWLLYQESSSVWFLFGPVGPVTIETHGGAYAAIDIASEFIARLDD